MAKRITVEELEDQLRGFQIAASKSITKMVLEEMIAGIGLHDIVNNCALASNSSLSERTINKCLKDDFQNDRLVENIMSIYYRLLFFPMLISGEKEMLQKIMDNDPNSRFVRDSFRKGCVSYLGSLPYNIVSNFISLPILLNHYPNGGNVLETAKMFAEIASKNKKLKDFASELGYTHDNLENIVNKNLAKMRIGFEKMQLIDSSTKEQITFVTDETLEKEMT